MFRLQKIINEISKMNSDHSPTGDIDIYLQPTPNEIKLAGDNNCGNVLFIRAYRVRQMVRLDSEMVIVLKRAKQNSQPT